ncbi:hypothetical protein SAMN05518871_11349 [Psychrobacillus sp. OK028]|uniref:hypothetical protein n=1 Tax=Psychrobacillus sp. OK028 TaxID=1884359 RepID=UPI00088349EB|nr:hypothetical protein [Psychrobacillus sp. OK028]SDO25431.1 hypothetical protein SAMN05518871_11349 [Psychrobacillus sp. OK028]
MIFVILVLYGIIAGVFISKKKMNMSQATIPMIAFAILSSVALGQNYTESLIPEANDGIAISNFLAKFLLPDDYWTKEMFLSRFELYLGISIALIILYFIFLIVEKIKVNVKS